MVNITVSLRRDEQKAISEWIVKHGVSRHELIKFAIRRFLFPHERYVPLNGRHIHVESFNVHSDKRGVAKGNKGKLTKTFQIVGSTPRISIHEGDLPKKKES